MSRRAAAMAVVSAALITGACGAEPLSVAEFERVTGVPAPPQPDPATVAAEGGEVPDFARPSGVTLPEGVGGGSTRAPERRSTRTETPIGFAEGALVAGTALGLVGKEAGLAEVTLYDGYGIVTTYAANGDVDRVVVRGNRSEGPTPLPNSVVREREAARFAPTDMDWNVIPSLVERTPGDLGVTDGQVSHVTVTKNLPFSPDLVIRVYVSSARSGGRIDYFADGRPMRAFRD